MRTQRFKCQCGIAIRDVFVYLLQNWFVQIQIGLRYIDQDYINLYTSSLSGKSVDQKKTYYI